jgi:hypothetical protein
MCRENREYFLILLAGLSLSCAAGALQGEEPEPWYLISEPELRIIEEYKEKSEAESRTWLLQVRELKALAYSLRRESETLNGQLSQAREANRRLDQSFNELERETLTLISSKNGEIAGLKQTAADRALEAEAYKGTARSRLHIIIALAGAWAVFIAFKACRFFKVI